MKTSLKIIITLLLILVAVILFLPKGLVCNDTKAKVVATKIRIRGLNAGIDHFKIDTGQYPSEEHGLNHLMERYDVKKWNGPYWEKSTILPDLWRNPFEYKLIRNIPIVISSGADGKFGTHDDVETGLR